MGLRALWPPPGCDPEVFFWNTLNRTAFLIDGFNLYHSVREASRALHGASTKWLDIRKLCGSYLHIVGGGASLKGVHYFSALAKHLEAKNPQVTKRHRDLLQCFRDDGIHVELARFKKKTVRCDHCGKATVRREEKETDVAIAATLFELLHRDAVDSVLIMSGDTDLAPATRTVKSLFPDKTVGFVFPYGRKNKELAQIADLAFQITKEQYARYQLADPYIMKSGRTVAKPAGW